MLENSVCCEHGNIVEHAFKGGPVVVLVQAGRTLTRVLQDSVTFREAWNLKGVDQCRLCEVR